MAVDVVTRYQSCTAALDGSAISITRSSFQLMVQHTCNEDLARCAVPGLGLAACWTMQGLSGIAGHALLGDNCLTNSDSSYTEQPTQKTALYAAAGGWQEKDKPWNSNAYSDGDNPVCERTQSMLKRTIRA